MRNALHFYCIKDNARRAGFENVSIFIKHAALENSYEVRKVLLEKQRQNALINSKLLRIIELQREIISNIEWVSLHMIKEEKVKE